ncbi:partial peptidoglycan LD-endopeptidase LytH, partial [uncultured bacterium]
AMEQLNAGFDSLLAKNNDMRLAMSLQPLSKEEIPVGVGGGYFDNKIDLLGGSSKDMLHQASSVLDIVQRKFDLQKQNLSEIYTASLQRRELFSAIPAIKPCEGSYSSSFGIRVHPFSGMRHFHAGLDIIADVGTPVTATGDGVVLFAGPKKDYGIAVEIDHGFGYRTLYAHLSKTDVTEGQKVKRGALIGKTGNTGLSTGPHLHYEVTHNGTNLDPIEFIFNDKTVLSLQSDK